MLRKQVLRAAMTREESKALLADLVIDAYELALIHALGVLRHGAGLITADRDPKGLIQA